MVLYNKYDRDTLRKKLEQEEFKRTTISFYRYVILDDPNALRDILYDEWNALGVLGRIYLAKEGVNAQFNVPEHNVEAFRANLESREAFKNMPFKIAVEDDGKSFLKLMIKVKNKIVADGLDDGTFDVTNVGNHLDAESFNEAMNDPNTVVVDMRNHYESEVGYFKGAILPDVETFKEELPKVKDMLEEQKDKKVLLYCTGGIRCEKASAFLKHHGFEDVNQLHGGIIDYARQVNEKGLESKFIGKNFVFDERLSESITDDVVSNCHQCGEPCDVHVNCSNVACNLLFIQCTNCGEKYEACCTPKCRQINALTEEEQFELRQGKENRKRFSKGLSDPLQLIRLIEEQENSGLYN
jgi:UPF0176 protein